ncbi:hypothetical protein CPB97_005993, partial [Podila verticillata]
MRLNTILSACALFALSSVKAHTPAPNAVPVVAAASNGQPSISAEGQKKIDPSLYPSLSELEERTIIFNDFVAQKEDKEGNTRLKVVGKAGVKAVRKAEMYTEEKAEEIAKAIAEEMAGEMAKEMAKVMVQEMVEEKAAAHEKKAELKKAKEKAEVKAAALEKKAE